jgi:hypothetical protein
MIDGSAAWLPTKIPSSTAAGPDADYRGMGRACCASCRRRPRPGDGAAHASPPSRATLIYLDCDFTYRPT